MKRRFIFSVLTGLSIYETVYANNLRLQVESVNYSENFSLGGVLNDLEGSEFSPSGSHSFSHSQLSLIFEPSGNWAKNLSFSLFNRHDYWADYTPAAAQMLYADRNNLPFENGTYEVFTYIKHIQAYGAKAEYNYFLQDNFKIRSAVSILWADDMIDGYMSGQLTLTSDEISQGVGQLDYQYGKDLIFSERQVDLKPAYGATVDVALDWQLSEKMQLVVSSQDIFSRVWWQEVPYTTADATTQVSRTDENGLLIVRPILSGQHSQKNATQKYYARHAINMQYQGFDKWLMSQQVFNIKDVWLTTSQVEYALTPSIDIGVSYEWVSGAPGGHINWDGFSIGLRSDNFDLADAKYLHAYAGWRVGF